MPQISGKVQGELVALLSSHFNDPGQIDRALLHADLGGLSQHVEQAPLPAMLAELIRKFADQYRTPELVQALLEGDHLQGQCPPLAQWLLENREKLPPPPPPGCAISLTAKVVLAVLLVGFIGLLAPEIRQMYDSTPPKTLLNHDTPLALSESLAVLETEYQARPTSGMLSIINSLDEQERLQRFGYVVTCDPLPQEWTRPTVSIAITDRNGDPIDEREDLVDVHWIAPDKSHESSELASTRVSMKHGVAAVQHPQTVPVGTVIYVVYYYQTYRSNPPQISVWIE